MWKTSLLFTSCGPTAVNPGHLCWSDPSASSCNRSVIRIKFVSTTSCHHRRDRTAVLCLLELLRMCSLLQSTHLTAHVLLIIVFEILCNLWCIFFVAPFTPALPLISFKSSVSVFYLNYLQLDHMLSLTSHSQSVVLSINTLASLARFQTWQTVLWIW